MLNLSEEISMQTAEAGLVARLKQGEAAAWQELCEKYGQPLYLYALHRTGCDPAAADDIRQETFLVAVKAIGSYRGDVPLFGWLCGIARHKAGDVLRQRRRAGPSLSWLETVEEAEPVLDWTALGQRPMPPEVVEGGQARALLVQALWSLPVDYRAVLLRRYLRGEGVDEVAQRLGRTYKATESLLERARQALRRLLKEMKYE